MKQARLVAFATATVLGFSAWTGIAGAALLDGVVTDTQTVITSAGDTIDPTAVRYFVDRLAYGQQVQVSVSPSGDVSLPSVGGAIVSPPPPPPIVRDLLVRIAYKLQIEGEVVLTVGSYGSDVSLPSVGGVIVSPPPPPPIVRDLLDSIEISLPTSRVTYLVAESTSGIKKTYVSDSTRSGAV